MKVWEYKVSKMFVTVEKMDMRQKASGNQTAAHRGDKEGGSSNIQSHIQKPLDQMKLGTPHREVALLQRQNIGGNSWKGRASV